MDTAVTTSNEKLNQELAAYRKVHRAVRWAHYLGLAVLFLCLCDLFVESHGFMPASLWIFVQEVACVAGIFYLVYICDTKRGLMNCVWHWERSLAERLRREEGMQALREGGIYIIDDWEMTLVEGFLVPKQRFK